MHPPPATEELDARVAPRHNFPPTVDTSASLIAFVRQTIQEPQNCGCEHT